MLDAEFGDAFIWYQFSIDERVLLSEVGKGAYMCPLCTEYDHLGDFSDAIVVGSLELWISFPLLVAWADGVDI